MSMLKEYYEKQKEKKIEEIIAIANKENNNYLLLREKLNAYSFFCYKHNLKSYSLILDTNEFLDTSYIIESTPDLLEVDKNKIKNVVDHLKIVNENNKNDLNDGITLEEAGILLEGVIQLARENLNKYLKGNIKIYDLTGACGFMQAFTLFPLHELGLSVTINNVSHFPGSKVRHAFGTTSIPIKENNEIYRKSYLIDGSYRQFFMTKRCIEGRFYNTDVNFKDRVGPDAGYYVCLTEEGRKFAKTLLKRGFIEWTEETAKIYGNGFTCESIINIKNLNAYHKIRQIPKKLYFENVYFSQEIIDYTKEELESDGYILDLDTEERRH